MIMVSMFDMTISMIKLLVVKVERSAVRHSDDFCVCCQGSAVKSTPDQNRVIRQKRPWAIRFLVMRVIKGLTKKIGTAGALALITVLEGVSPIQPSPYNVNRHKSPFVPKL